jgi:hypothetical protein
MIPLPINLAVFDTSKGHWGRTDIYRRAISDLATKLPLNHFQNRLVHIKVGDGEERVLAEQIDFYKPLGFQIVTTKGQWSHGNVNHQVEYCRDLVNVYGLHSLMSTPFTLHLESDWGWSSNGELIDHVVSAMSYLNFDHQCLGVRFPRFLNEVERLGKLKEKHNLDVTVEAESCVPYSGKFYRHNDNLSLNPTIFRTRDLWTATRILKMHFDQLSSHSEMGFTKAFTFLADGAKPWAIFDPKNVSVLHWGTKEGEEDKEGQVYDR